MTFFSLSKRNLTGLSSKWRGLAISIAAAAAISIPGPVLADTAKDEESITTRSLSGSYLAARIALNDKDTQAAVDYYRRAMKFDPDNADLRQETFTTLLSNGDFDEAIKLGKTIKNEDSPPEILQLALAVDALRGRDFKSARKELDVTWQTALDRLLAGLVLGWAEQGAGDTAAALATIDELSGPSWFDLFVQYHGGLIALVAGDNKDAIKRLQAAVDNRAGGQAALETYSGAVEALAIAQARDGDFDAARKTLEDNSLNRQNPVFKQLLTSISAEKAPAGKVTTAQHGAAEVFLNIGSAINKQGGEQFAGMYFHMAAALAPKMDAVSVTLGDYYDRLSALDRANNYFKKIGEKSPYRRIAQLELALNMDELEQLEEAKQVMEGLIEDDPSDLVTYLSYGAVLARHEKFAEASKVYERAKATIGTPQNFHWNLFYRSGIAYERTKQWPKAEADFKKALELFPNEPRVLNYLGYSWVDMNMNLEEGLAMIQKAVDIRPDDGYMVDSLGWAYYRLGKFEDAVRELERAVELRPADPTINDHLGDAYWRAGRKLEATYQWSHALNLEPLAEDEKKIRLKLRDGMPDEPKDSVAQPPKEEETATPEKKS